MSAIETRRVGSVAVVELNRPERGNALTGTMPREIGEAVTALGADTAISGIVLTGAGRLFCVGGDAETLLDWRELSLPDRADRFTDAQSVVHALRACPVPVVAAINGPAAGAGVDLAAVCDMRVAADSASFTAAFAAVGLVPDLGGSWTLPRLIGRRHALAFLLGGEKFRADDALRIGLVDEVVPAAEVVGAATRAVATMCGDLPRSVITETLLAVRSADVDDLASSLIQAAQTQARLMAAAEHQERIAAYLPAIGRTENTKEIR